MIGQILTRRNILQASGKRYAAMQAEQLAKASERLGIAIRPHEVTAPIYPYINHGRWVADCRGCGSGMAADPDEPVCRCMECGAVFISVYFPLERQAIEAVLIRREALSSRNWTPAESLADLTRENAEHEVPYGVD